MDRRILPGFDAWFHSQHPHLVPASASSTGLPLFRPFESTPALLPPLAPMPLMPQMPLLAPMLPLPTSGFIYSPAASSASACWNFPSSAASFPGRENVRMGFSIEEILKTEPAQPRGLKICYCFVLNG